MRGRYLGRLREALRRTDVPAGGARAAGSGDLLLRVLCHELRTPVTSLTSLTRALADETSPLTGEQRRAISALARDHAAYLQNLLTEAATSVGALTLLAGGNDHAVPLAEVLPAVAMLVPAERRRVRVTREAARCAVSARRTRQMVGNLVENALRHGPAAGRVGIHAACRGADLSIRVLDEGHVADTLIEALRRPAPAVGMSGLGLWIVRELVAVDGGQVRLHRLRPTGVAVEVLLPARRAG
ncbi:MULTISPECIES: HAMP domain-containing sensor histidine kinase [unclassified Micromonospora]|uniref:sensor histidine kinase n=1 Tax=unclassified Micromonospora TaxID=2617518 RepID=UPI0022B6BE48|nr:MULTISPECIES: HAMP domain-containing sensor histidine kinase [unclassified Micromonospora]MCZ7422800.1 HAMP domain-containing sensor histidine kinase [Verrucosispora sp. WMMA2121]WBB90538.1 HAMP domain-containing sensor histidine kinase [Verrucosispora sp. WMMC514]